MKKKQAAIFSLFILFALILLIGGHYLLFVFLEDVYELYDSPLRGVLAFVLGIFSVGYILASFIARWSDNVVTRVFYAATSVWLGLAWYVAVASIAAIIIGWLTTLVGFTGSLPYLTTAGLFLAVTYTVLGVINAYRPVVKSHRVQIKNLPDSWQGKKVVQISDVHLGHVHGRHFFRSIIQQVNELNPDVVFITGDLFDGMGGDFNYIVKVLNSVHAPMGLYYVIGNHETYMDFESVHPLIEKSKARLLRDEIIELDGVQIAGADYPPPGTERTIGPLVARLDSGKPSILLWHEPVDIETAKKAGVSLVLSGHTHRGQMFPFEWVAKRVYKQFEYGLVTDGAFNQYTSSGVGTWGPPMRTGNSPEIVLLTLQKSDS